MNINTTKKSNITIEQLAPVAIKPVAKKQVNAQKTDKIPNYIDCLKLLSSYGLRFKSINKTLQSRIGTGTSVRVQSDKITLLCFENDFKNVCLAFDVDLQNQIDNSKCKVVKVNDKISFISHGNNANVTLKYKSTERTGNRSHLIFIHSTDILEQVVNALLKTDINSMGIPCK